MDRISIKKLEVLDKGGLKIEYVELQASDEDDSEIVRSIKCPINMGAKLGAFIDKLGYHVARFNRLYTFDAEAKKADIMQFIEVRSMIMKGSGCKIEAVLETPDAQSIAVSTPFIKYRNESYTFALELQEEIDVISAAALKYVSDVNMESQLSLRFEGEGEPAPA